MTNQFWDERYQDEEYVYGREPNAFFKAHLDTLPPGNILLPGEGEGRNAVYAAKTGWIVTAFDYSGEGRNKALRLASEEGTTIRYETSSYHEFNYRENFYDAAGLFFVHLPGEDRKNLHSRVISSLRPGGVILLEAFHVDQFENDTGGPRHPDWLFDEECLQSDFSELDIRLLDAHNKQIEEGRYHQGTAAVINMIARKK
jgi:SAM-dependent methyltransferase